MMNSDNFLFKLSTYKQEHIIEICGQCGNLDEKLKI